MKKAYLVLEDGSVFPGYSFGAETACTGELVFTTGMGGYIETLTDPSYYGQIVLQTFPLMGNYGIIEEDFEGECWLNGYVVREWCDTPSNFRCQYTLDTFLKKRGIPGVFGVDTREITKRIREQGVMNARICTELPDNPAEIAAYQICQAVSAVMPAQSQVFPAWGEKKFQVVLLDYGAKRNIIRCLQKRGCQVIVVPCSWKAEQILACQPDGIMLSNGPGDPAENTAEIAELQKILGKVPVFGICLGHQLLALANGGKTKKLKYGHRGVNQPVTDVCSGRTYITTQNHGYAVVSDSMKTGTIRFVNANDGTCEGIDYPEQKAFSVQFHPEACAGPLDTQFLFDRFSTLMEGEKSCR